MNSKSLFLCALLGFSINYSLGQGIANNVHWRMEAGEIKISYDLPKNIDSVNIDATFCNKDNPDFHIQVKTAKGSIGKGKFSGAGQLIIWDCKADGLSNLPKGNYYFQVSANVIRFNDTFSEHIQPVVAVLSLVFTCTSALLLITISIIRFRRAWIYKQLESLKTSLDIFLVSASTAPTDDVLNEIILKAQAAFKKHVRNSTQAKFIVTDFLNIYRSLDGQSKKNLSRLFSETVLLKFTLEDLSKRNWNIKAWAIETLTELEVETHIPKIEEFAIHHNISLQQVAQRALVRLKGYEGLNFLEKLNNPLSEWQQISLLTALSHLNKKELPDFRKWLTHKEDSIKIFCIRLALHFSENYDCEELEALAGHKNEKVRDVAVAALKQITFGSYNHALNRLDR